MVCLKKFAEVHFGQLRGRGHSMVLLGADICLGLEVRLDLRPKPALDFTNTRSRWLSQYAALLMASSSGKKNVLRLNPYGCSRFNVAVSTTSRSTAPCNPDGAKWRPSTPCVTTSSAAQSSAL